MQIEHRSSTSSFHSRAQEDTFSSYSKGQEDHILFLLKMTGGPHSLLTEEHRLRTIMTDFEIYKSSMIYYAIQHLQTDRGNVLSTPIKDNQEKQIYMRKLIKLFKKYQDNPDNLQCIFEKILKYATKILGKNFEMEFELCLTFITLKEQILLNKKDWAKNDQKRNYIGRWYGNKNESIN